MTADEEAIRNFKPPFVWPNPAFPFRLYLDHPKCRIFIIENLSHNWEWMSKYRDGIRETDFFFVLVGWYFDEPYVRKDMNMLKALGLNTNNFFILCNDKRELDVYSKVGFNASIINQNAWLDENKVMRPMPEVDKKYNAIYVARRSEFKRHMLAENVENLALVAGINHGFSISEIPSDYAYLNDSPLKPEEVCEKINQSHVGLILSAREGSCYASSEYLLCGVPVVSTASEGGRATWYNEYNSRVVDANPEAVAAGVEYFLSHPRDPQRIRQLHVEQSRKFRTRFVETLGDVLRRFGVTDMDPERYFWENYLHKMRKSIKPDFKKLFA